MESQPTTKKKAEPAQLQQVLKQLTELFSEYYHISDNTKRKSSNNSNNKLDDKRIILLSDIIIPDSLSTFLWSILSCLARYICHDNTVLCSILYYIPFMPATLLNSFENLGFLIGSSSWLVFAITKRFNSSPLIQIRICEMTMSRISLYELAVLIPSHFLSAVLGVMVSYVILQDATTFTPILYDSKSPWLLDLMKEVFVNSLFCVSLLVLPELFKLNFVSIKWIPIVMLPIYTFGVDSAGNCSAFAPELIYAFGNFFNKSNGSSHNWSGNFRQSPHLLGPLIGGFVAGKIMNAFFPDR